MSARTHSTKVLATIVAFSSLFIAGFIGTVVSLSHFRPANAYNDYDFICGWTYGGGYSALSLPYRTDPDFPSYGYYTTMLASAISTWNGTATPVDFYSTSSGAHTIGVKDMGATVAGVVAPTCYGSGGSRSSTALYLNTYYVGNNSGSVFYGTGVASHEFGHYLGLGHSWYWAIMGTNDGSFNSPRTDDVCGVNVVYPNSSYSPSCGY